MARGINDFQNDRNYTSKHFVYREGVRVKFANANKDIVACILPAIGDKEDKASFLPYRDEENPDAYTNWAVGVYFHPFVGKESNIISAKTFDPDAYDPIQELIKTAKADPKYALIAGYGSDGKKIPNAYKNEHVRLGSMWSGYVVNSIILYDKDNPSDKPVILQIPIGAFTSRDSESKGWGLLSELGRKNRKAEKGSADEYYWGDITDPRKLVPCSLKICPGPTGGISIYNMVPLDDEDPIKTTSSVLKARYDLDSIFNEITEGEIISKLIYYFSDTPKLLERAFSRRVPGIEAMIKKATGVSVTSTSYDDDEEEDEIPDAEFRRPAAKAGPSKRNSLDDEEEESADEPVRESARSFEPEEDELPAPASKRATSLDDDDELEDVVVESVPQRKKATKSSVAELFD